MLRFAEEILLLIIDNEKGEFAASLSSNSLNVVLVGAVLMDLALQNRVDTDQVQLMVIDSTPIGDSLLDPVLAEIAKEPSSHPITYWLERLAVHGESIRDEALKRLEKHGILEYYDAADGFFLSNSVFRSRRYPSIQGEVIDDVQVRIYRLLFSDDVPTPHDIVIVSLANSCGLFHAILTRDELEEVKERIDIISALDLIGQRVGEALKKVQKHTAPLARPAASIPMVRGLPIVGSIFELTGDLNSFLVEQYRKHGPVFQISALNRQFIVLAGPEATRFAQKQGRHYLRSHETWVGLFAAMGAKQGLASMDGPGHIHMRKAHKPAYSQRFFENRLDQAADITKRRFSDLPQKRPIAGHKFMQHLVAEQLTLILAGVSAHDHVDEVIRYLRGLLKVYLTQQWPGWLLRLPPYRRARRRMFALYDMVLDSNRNMEVGTDRNLIDDLLELHEKEPQLMSETDLLVAVLGPFFVGVETVANTMGFTLYAMLKHPELLSRVTAEADDYFSEQPLSARKLRGLNVIRRVVMESLRLYNAAPALKRTVANSFEFANYTVPAGAEIIIGHTVAHHLEEFYPDPERFDIERYTPERSEHLQTGAYNPFGLGTHRCLGSKFAETQLALTMLTMVRNFELELFPQNYEIKIINTPGRHPASSFKFRIRNERVHGITSDSRPGC